MRVACRLGFGEQLAPRGVGGEYDIHRPLRAARRLLGKPPDPGARRHDNAAMLDADFACDRAEQRGLADAVTADEPNARAFGNARGRAVQQQTAGNADRNIVEHEHGAALSAANGTASASAPTRCAPPCMSAM